MTQCIGWKYNFKQHTGGLPKRFLRGISRMQDERGVRDLSSAVKAPLNALNTGISLFAYSIHGRGQETPKMEP